MMGAIPRGQYTVRIRSRFNNSQSSNIVKTAQVVETSVTVTNSSFQNYTHPNDHIRQTTNSQSAVSTNYIVIGVNPSLFLLRYYSFSKVN